MKLRAQVKHITGLTSHYFAHVEQGELVRDNAVPVPYSVEIEAADGAFYMYYLDSQGMCLTDTWHRTLAEAKSQAMREFEISEGDWESVEP